MPDRGINGFASLIFQQCPPQGYADWSQHRVRQAAWQLNFFCDGKLDLQFSGSLQKTPGGQRPKPKQKRDFVHNDHALMVAYPVSYGRCRPTTEAESAMMMIAGDIHIMDDFQSTLNPTRIV